MFPLCGYQLLASSPILFGRIVRVRDGEKNGNSSGRIEHLYGLNGQVRLILESRRMPAMKNNRKMGRAAPDGIRKSIFRRNHRDIACFHMNLRTSRSFLGWL
jgi:hypothetical protein